MKNKWTTDNMPDLSGKTIIVTGGNSGLGFESVKAFAHKGATVILASRSIEKGENAKAQIGQVKGDVQVMQLDLQDFASIKNFAEQFKASHSVLDVLLNNAGIMTTPYFTTKEGLEGQTGTNHFGHFALTAQLFDLIKKTPGSRIVSVSSSAHNAGSMDFDNLLYEGGKGYSKIKAYGRSKLMNLLFTYELQRKIESEGLDVIAVASHPGASRTNLDRYLKGKWWYYVLYPLFFLITTNQAKGALSQIRASVDANVKGGEYYGPHRGMSGYPVKVESNEASHNIADAKKLWEVSEELTKQKFQSN
jgi:NAD(P)-dependent dehydrogenase (short-subunit alcohol dehydrogenase family)